MKVSILIVTYQKDFPWLHWCLRSIAKFAKGFAEVVVCIPSSSDWHQVLNFATGYTGSAFLRFSHFDEWPGKGFVHHMERIMYAEQICPKADFILHMDADCIFIERVTPEDYFVDGKPVLINAPYHWILQKFNCPAVMNWKRAVEMAIGGVTEREGMRRHPAVHYRETYQRARDAILRHTRRSASDYIRGTRNQFPQQFAEFPTLAEVAWREMRPAYHWIAQEKEPWPKDKLYQWWSHGPMNQPQEVRLPDGTKENWVPLKVMEKIL